LAYLSLDAMVEATGAKKDDFCLACFDGSYPIDIPESVREGKMALEGCV
jgi:amidophosphoribosyltransferase